MSLGLGGYGGSRRVGVFYERGTPVYGYMFFENINTGTPPPEVSWSYGTMCATSSAEGVMSDPQQVVGPCASPTVGACRATSLTKKRTRLGPYRRPMPRVLGVSKGGGRFLMGEVPLYICPTVGAYEPPRRLRKI